MYAMETLTQQEAISQAEQLTQRIETIESFIATLEPEERATAKRELNETIRELNRIVEAFQIP